jgi:hypothetical protein
MKRVQLTTDEIGLVVKNNAVIRVLKSGNYWLGFGEKLEKYTTTHPFPSGRNVDVLLQLTGFRELVDIVEVGDTEICLVFLNGNFEKTLASGRHVFWKELRERRFQLEDITEIEIPASVNRQLLEKQSLGYYVRQYKIEPNEKALLFVDGVFVDILKSGTYCWWKNAKTIAILKADMRVLTLEVVGQEILSKDKAQIRINFTLQYQIVDIVKALLDNKEYEKQLYSLMQLTLRSYIGQMTLDELMERKTEIQSYVLENTLPQVAGLGITLLTCGVKDVILPGDVRDIMNQVLIAEKRAQANSIMRREETASTRSLLNTAKLMEENSMLFKLKEMEYVEKIAEKINTISVSGNGQIVDQLKQLFVK